MKLSEMRRKDMSTYLVNAKLKDNPDIDIFFKKILGPFIKEYSTTDQLNEGDNDEIMRAYISAFFNERFRKIVTCKAVKRFKMPGMYLKRPAKPVQGMVFWVEEGSRIYVRVDKRYPDSIDVQVVQQLKSEKGFDIPTFRLTRSEYKKIINCIEE